VGQLKKAGQLEKIITKTKENLSPAGQKSFTKFYNLEKEVTAYRKTKTPLSEAKIRGMLHKHDIHPPARPKGVPSHYKAEFAERGVGIKFVDPSERGTYVRVMPGKPHSKNLCQQRPDIKQQINGHTLDKQGKIVKKGHPPETSHMSPEEFVYREAIKK